MLEIEARASREVSVVPAGNFFRIRDFFPAWKDRAVVSGLAESPQSFIQ
jgi:hypothetical protein